MSNVAFLPVRTGDGDKAATLYVNFAQVRSIAPGANGYVLNFTHDPKATMDWLYCRFSDTIPDLESLIYNLDLLHRGVAFVPGPHPTTICRCGHRRGDHWGCLEYCLALSTAFDPRPPCACRAFAKP